MIVNRDGLWPEDETPYLFYEDLLQKVTYIEEKLHNPKAASELIDVVEKAIQARASCAESFEPYPSTREREMPYYAIYVKNFVDEKMFTGGKNYKR